MRDRLIELMKNQFIELFKDGDWNFGEMIVNVADRILADGWIRPLCKVGDKVYVLYPDPRYNWGNKELKVLELKVYSLRYFDNGMHIEMRGDGKYITWGISSFGVSIFLTKEEAEKALEERK